METIIIFYSCLGRVHILVVLMFLHSTLVRGREEEKEGEKEEERENMNENHT